MIRKILYFAFTSLVWADGIDYNAAITVNYGDSYDFYSYTENRFDLNLFYNNVQAWVQYEYSNPPEIGFSINDIRKFRIEYKPLDFTIKLGDIYEFWGRGLVLNQFDDQITNFDNGTRGLFLGYSKGPFTINHINGNTDIWQLGNDLRIPYYKHAHNMYANQVQYELNSLSLGFTQLHSKETHQKIFGEAFVNHKLNGIYASWTGANADLFLEYADKKATEKTNIIENIPHDTLKNGYGIYSNLNIYLGNWGLSTEYKRYAFDRGYSDFTVDDYGNQIDFQTMPTLVREQNSTLMGRVTHQYNYNDERGVQFALNGTLPNGYYLLAQYSQLSRNEEWQSVTSINWNGSTIEGYLPSSDPSAIPYWENYQEMNGYHFDDKLYFKLGRGENYEVLELMRYFEGEGESITENWVYTDSIEWDNGWFYTDSVLGSIDASNYSIEAKLWQESRSITFPFELSYTFDNGYSVGLNFEYQERKIRNVTRGNATTFNYSDSTWLLVNPENPDTSFIVYDTQFSDGDKQYNTQFNRMISLTLSKASIWSVTLSHDQTNAFEGQRSIDPYYNPLEALVYGDIKYFTGKRDKSNPPGFIQKRWVSVKIDYSLTPSQRISVQYGSIQGGLFCSNGVCRIIPPFNDGLTISYTAVF